MFKRRVKGASAVIAAPVLAGTSAYVIAQATDRQGNLDARFGQARSFYLALLASLAAGVAVTFLGIGPIRLLFYGSIAGGLGTPVTLAMMLLAARQEGHGRAPRGPGPGRRRLDRVRRRRGSERDLSVANICVGAAPVWTSGRTPRLWTRPDLKRSGPRRAQAPS